MRYTFEDEEMYIYEAAQHDIDNMVWPDTMKTLMIHGDYVDHIVVPEGVDTFACRKALMTCKLPDSIEFLYLENNRIKEIELPQDIIIADVSDNYLESITFRGGRPQKLKELYVQNNRLKTLEFHPPQSLNTLNIRFNHGLTMNKELVDYINHTDIDLIK
jgi:hypothetical protein